MEKDITNISLDSREIRNNGLFAAIPGTIADGHDFIDMAVSKGASVIVFQNRPGNLHENTTYIQVDDSAATMGIIASNFYNRPSENIKLIGITGTNGKTTTVTLLYNLFTRLGYKTGMLSTIENYIGNKKAEATHTTPDPVRLNRLLAEMSESGCEYCFMEVSSHALEQKRTEGLRFSAGIFSNISHDHLDYHGTFENYIRAKKKFFDNLPPSALAIINVDDKNSTVMVQNTRARVIKYGMKTVADCTARVIEKSMEGMQLKINRHEFWTPMVGEFNVYNMLAVFATAVNMGIPDSEVLQHMSLLTPAKGRFEVVRSKDNITAVIDYAHTPDALENVLTTIQGMKGKGRVICVVGAGGNRDKSKRPVMAKIAGRNSDKVILTSDNPRNEDPEDIIKDMYNGIRGEMEGKFTSVTEREMAIKTSLVMAQPGDVILIAGKGHETYQEIKGVKHHFDDREIVLKQFKIME